NLAATGIGRPVTSGVDFYERDSLGLYDFEGLESFADLKTLIDTFRKVYRKRLKQDPEHAIHAVWYCVKASDRRVDAQQEEALHRLAVDMKLVVFLVVTQTPWYPERGLDPSTVTFLHHLKERNLPIVGGSAVAVAALDDEYTGTEAFGLTSLVNRPWPRCRRRAAQRSPQRRGSTLMPRPKRRAQSSIGLRRRQRRSRRRRSRLQTRRSCWESRPE